ncbi:restriction endonuclease subunit S, partial [Lacicoccus alkaliphilus]|uniref:restriction endonuclease subunit S n=1 Tax=Lacicoccus alkaliphilus TaxID=148453 RepID=UPI0039F14306
MGHSPKSENYTSNPEDYVLVQGNADIINGWVSPRVWTTQITSLIKSGSILISVRAPVGNVGKTAYDVVIGRGMAAFEGDEFLYQLLNKMHIEGYWRKVSTGSTFESINSKDIKEASIHLPEHREKDNIGKFLKTLDSYTLLH